MTLVTQSLVDRDDPEGMEPRKFIGRAVSEDLARELGEKGFVVGMDDRGNLRRRVASPNPVGLVEAAVVRDLVQADCVVIAAGGGGTPVYEDDLGVLEGLDVVIDKDLAASLLAREIRASVLLILTDVDAVYRDWRGARAEPIRLMTTAEARAFLESDEAGAGSMRPKLRAAAQFVEEGGERAIIAALADAERAMAGEAGTTIAASQVDGAIVDTRRMEEPFRN